MEIITEAGPGSGEGGFWPFYRVSCMLLQASQLHLPAPPHSLSPIAVTLCVKDPVEHGVFLSDRVVIHKDFFTFLKCFFSHSVEVFSFFLELPF